MLWLILGLIGAAVVFLAVMWRVGASAGDPAVALAAFSRRRAELQADFFARAASSGKPRGLRWKSLGWEGAVVLVRDRGDRRLTALVGVTVAFEAVEGGEMEGVEAVGNLRHGSAVFFYHRGAWHTTGKALFNLSPDEAVERFAARYERVPHAG